MPVSPKIGAKYGAQIARLVDSTEIALLRMIATAIRTGADDQDWLQQKLAQLQLLRRRITFEATRLDATLAQEIHRVVLEAYNVGSSLAVTDLERAGRVASVTADPTGAAAVLARKIAQDVHQSLALVPDILTGIYRQSVDAAVQQVLGGSITRRAGSQMVLDDSLANGITGFVDTAGRAWSLDTYAEMAVRTGTADAAIAGHIATLQASGVDLVVISDHGGSCPLCAPWEGKILSSSGDVAGMIMPSVTDGSAEAVDVAGSLDEATDAGLFHPNCSHTADAYLPGATDVSDDAGDAPTVGDIAAAQTSDGSELYQAEQRQRTIERTIRSWKRRGALALDDKSAAQAAGKVSQWQSVLREHVDANDLKRLPYREQIGNAH